MRTQRALRSPRGLIQGGRNLDRRAAGQIVPMLTRAAAEIAWTIDVFRAHASEEQIEAYANAVGEVVFAIDGVLRPIISEHPDLHP